MIVFLLYPLIIALVVYGFLKHVFSFWDRRGFPYIKPVVIPFGNLRAFAKRERAFGVAVSDLYNVTTRPYIGMYAFTRPAVLVRDADLVKQVLITECEHFYDRGVYVNEKKDEMSATLFSLRGQDWKKLRQKMTPLFTTGKLKGMFPTFQQEIDKLDRHIEQRVDAGEIVEMKSTLLMYVLNVIASVFFGLQVDCFKDPDNEWKTVHSKINTPDFLSNIRTAIIFLAPGLVDLFNIPMIPSDIREYFVRITRETIQYREENNVRRNDFMQQVIDMRKEDKASGAKVLSVEKIAGNSFLFFTAGTEASSGTAAYILYEVAKDMKIQKKLQTEIDEVLAKNGGEITYDAIGELKYLDLVVKG